VAGVVRVAAAEEMPAVGQLLFDFNTEYDEPTPPAEVIAEVIAGLDDAVALIVGDPPHGIALLRFRKSIWTEGNECYLAELYVRPPHRGNGDGRALMDAVLDLAKKRGADWIELNTDDDDHVAHRLYESKGFARTAHYYEREL
jgi:GNAT superfamily N-acetyltransferase